MTSDRAQKHDHERERPDRVDRRAGGAAAAHPLLALQRSAGNRGVESLMRAPALTPVPVAAGVIQRLLDEKTLTRVRKQGKAAYDSVDNRMTHIRQRHGAGSTATGAGKFADNAKIRSWIKTGIDSGTIAVNKNGGYEFEYQFAESIGTNINGKPAFSILVILTGEGKSAFINTAYPI